MRFTFPGRTLAARVRVNDDGFTITETMVAAVISLVLATTVTAVVLSSLTLAGKAQNNAVTAAKSQTALVNFESLVRDAANLVSVSPTQLVFTYQRESACELHTYLLESDPTNANSYRLSHTVRSVTLRAGTQCSNVESALNLGSIGSAVTTIEITALNTSSKFDYYADMGAAVSVYGSAGTTPAGAVPPCQVGSVALTLITPRSVEGSRSTATEVTRVGVRSNLMGTTC